MKSTMKGNYGSHAGLLRRIGTFCLVLAASLGLRAADGWPIETISYAEKGVWMDNFALATNLSFKTRSPMVLFWANQHCEFCEALEAEINSAEFKAWQAAHPDYIYNFVFAVDGNDLAPNADSGACDFARSAAGTIKPLKQYPFVCLYWPKADGSVAVQSYVGRAGHMDRASQSAGKSLGEEFEACIESFFAGYTPEQSVPEYTGGDLAFTAEYDNARLEAEVGLTDHVDIPLVRDAFTVGYPGTNTVKAVYGGATVLDAKFIWDPDQTEASVAVPVPPGAAAGEKITVTLYDAAGKERGKVNVYIAEQENSPKNPLFVGERTADTLQYGEWTMDLDVALAKYRADPESKLLVLVSGSLWCPDCVMTDAHLLDRAEFKEWAVSRKVILVDIDVPNFPRTTTSPSLLTRIVSRAGDSYISGRGTLAPDETQRYQSGAGYLSRHMVSDADAQSLFERNRLLAGRNTLDGGWNNPDRPNQDRTGIPNFFTLRRDGRLSGRLETFDILGPSEYKPAYLSRLDELLAVSDTEAGVEDDLNISWQTTKDKFSGDGIVGATLSAVDLIDTYELPSVASGAAEQTIMVGGVDSDTTVTVALLQVIDGEAETLATATGTLAGGVAVHGELGTGARYFVQITGAAKGSLALDSPAVVSAVEYALSGTRSAIENPYSNSWTTKTLTSALPLYGKDGSDTVLRGTLVIGMKKTQAVSAKFTNGRRSLAVFTGKWNSGSISAAGTVELTLEKKGYVLVLTLKADGTLSATVSNGDEVLSSGECAIDETYQDFAGYYTVLLPTISAGDSDMAPGGESFMTLKMASPSAKKSGKFTYAVYLADGMKLSGSAYVTWLDADFGVVPILNVRGTYTVAVAVKVRKDAPNAPSSRAVVAVEGVKSLLACHKSSQSFELEVGAHGSYYVGTRSLAEQSGVDSLAWMADASQLSDSQVYGALEEVAGVGSRLTVSAASIVPTKRTNGFTFRLNRSTGVFTGRMNLKFAKKQRMSAKFYGVILPGWFTDCDCSEDEDRLIPFVSLPFGCGYAAFPDKVGRNRLKRGFQVGMDVLDYNLQLR